MKIFLIKPAGT